MATWIAHLRVAEHVLARCPALDEDPFLVGSVAPDAGIPNEDRSSFEPPKEVTHWLRDGSVSPEAFRQEHLEGRLRREPLEGRLRREHLGGRLEEADRGEASFLAGYYAHLLADSHWNRLYARKLGDPAWSDGLAKDPRFIWTIKKDWYNLDGLYLLAHPDSVFFTRFRRLDRFPHTLPCFTKGEIEKQARFIVGYYGARKVDPRRPLLYLTELEMDTYVTEASELVLRAMGGLPLPEVELDRASGTRPASKARR